MFEQELRDAVTVKRWGIVRTLRDQDLAQHSFFVAHYVNDICSVLEVPEDVKLRALQVALWHDVRDETVSGDIPGPSKRAMVQDREAFDAKMDEWTTKLFGTPRVEIMTVQAYSFIHVVIKIADEMDQVFEMITEFRSGNTYAEPHIELAIARMKSWLSQLRGFVSYDAWGALGLQIDAAIHSHRHDLPKGPVVAL